MSNPHSVLRALQATGRVLSRSSIPTTSASSLRATPVAQYHTTGAGTAHSSTMKSKGSEQALQFIMTGFNAYCFESQMMIAHENEAPTSGQAAVTKTGDEKTEERNEAYETWEAEGKATEGSETKFNWWSFAV